MLACSVQPLRKIIARNIKNFRAQAGITQTQLGEKIGYKEETARKMIAAYEAAEDPEATRMPRPDQFEKLAEALKKPVWAFFMDTKTLADHIAEKGTSTEIGHVYSLAGAGAPKALTEYDPIESIVLPKELVKPNIALIKVAGDSMLPTIWKDAIVGVDTKDKKLVSGEIYAIWIPYEGAVIKRLYAKKDGVIVKSDNPRFPDDFFAYNELEETQHGETFLLGRVKWVLQGL